VKEAGHGLLALVVVLVVLDVLVVVLAENAAVGRRRAILARGSGPLERLIRLRCLCWGVKVIKRLENASLLYVRDGV
jgi:hypothetical protein